MPTALRIVCKQLKRHCILSHALRHDNPARIKHSVRHGAARVLQRELVDGDMWAVAVEFDKIMYMASRPDKLPAIYRELCRLLRCPRRERLREVIGHLALFRNWIGARRAGGATDELAKIADDVVAKLLAADARK